MSYKQWKDEPFDWAPQRKLGTKGWIAFKDAPSAPPPPNYAAAAEATAAGNLQAARYQTEANRVTQQGPTGSVSWTNNGKFDQEGYDAAMAAWNAMYAPVPTQQVVGTNDDGTPIFDTVMQPSALARSGMYTPPPDRADYQHDNWVQTTTLNPELQQALDAQINIQNQRSQIAQDQLTALAANYAKPFEAPDLQSYLEGLQGIDQTQLNANDYVGNLEKLRTDAPELAAYLEKLGVKGLEQDAPQFNPADADKFGQAAFDAQNVWLAPQYAKDEQALRNSLLLQGLDPRSEASDQATGSFYDSKNKAYNSLANSSLLTGQQIASGNYQNALAGFNATNSARNTAYQQALAGQQSDLAAFNSGNTARQGNYDNALKQMDAQRSNISAANAARDAAYAQAMQRYQADYASRYAQRVLPLNEVNSLLTGQQVSMPSFPSYAMQGQTAGPDYSSAAAAQSNYNQGIYNAGAASAAQGNAATGQAVGALAGAAAMFFF